TKAEMLQQYPDSYWAQQAAPDERLTSLSVLLLHEGQAIGQIQLRRPGGVPFSPEQVALVESFADQAEIAIENARLFEEKEQSYRVLDASNRELGEALEQQTAIAEVLGIISRAPLELARVLPALLMRAVTLVEADEGAISRTIVEDGGGWRGLRTRYLRGAATPETAEVAEVQDPPWNPVQQA